MQTNVKNFWDGWKHVGKFFETYWEAYGGFAHFLKSPYLHISLVVSLLCYGLWMKDEWWEVFITVNPAILGFTIGGFALLLATGAEKFGAILAKARQYDGCELDTPLAKLGSAFVHFILVQFFSITYAILAKSAYRSAPWPHCDFMASEGVRYVFWFTGFFIGVYALMCAIATAEWIFFIVISLIKFQKRKFKAELRRDSVKPNNELS